MFSVQLDLIPSAMAFLANCSKLGLVKYFVFFIIKGVAVQKNPVTVRNVRKTIINYEECRLLGCGAV
jgi:hypothetical protein